MAHMQDLKKATQRKASLGATAKAVLWAFLGIRKNRDREQDAAQLNPVHVIIAAIIGVLIFVMALVIIVNIVVAG
jgi:hypothetical protein